jgi:hypothetical protein
MCTKQAVDSIVCALSDNECMMSMHHANNVFVLCAHSGCIVRHMNGMHIDSMSASSGIVQWNRQSGENACGLSVLPIILHDAIHAA